jgi:hypothetical protein
MAESKYKGLLYSPEVLGGIGLLTAGLSGGSPDKALPSLLQGMQTAAMFRKQEDEDEKQRLIKEYADQVPADQKNAFLIAPKQWLDKNVFAKDKSAKFETFLSEDGKDKVTINTASKSGLEKATDLINNKGYDKISQSISGKNTSDLTTLSKKTTGDIEKKLLSGTQLQDNLVLQEIQFQPEFLTVQGKVKYKALKAKDLAGLQLDADEAAYLGNYSEWQQTNLQYFNQYRKEITGVAAGEKEMSWLQDSIPSERDTPTTYQAKLKNQMMIQKQVIENAREFQKTKGAQLYTTNADGDRVYSKEFGEYLKTKVKPSGEFISELFTSYRKDKMWDTDRTKRFMDYTFKGIDWESILTEYLEDQKN